MKKFEYLSFEDALALSLEKALPTRQCEVVMIDHALGRVLATDILTQKNLPSFDNSAMDGFAFKHKDCGKKLEVISTIFAGDRPTASLSEQSCYKIMTGAKIPSDADTIIPIEDCLEVTSSHITLPKEIKKGNAFRKKGEEKEQGSLLLEKGAVLSPSHIAILSAQGIVALEVYKELSIAVVSTGDEIKEPWQEADEDEIYNANAFGITALLKKYGFKPTYVGAISDDLQESITFIADLKAYDVIITTGGISMGDADFLEEAFIKNGLESFFHGINVKPGRPTMMGRMGKTYVMAMPGNPLTTMLNTFLLSLPILFKMQGNTAYNHPFVYAKNVKPFKANPTRANIVLGDFKEGVFHVTRNNRYGSGMLMPILESNAICILGEGLNGVGDEDMIKVILFDTLPLSQSNNNIN